MSRSLRSFRPILSLILITIAFACAGCALRDGYTPISAPGAPAGGYSCGSM